MTKADIAPTLEHTFYNTYLGYVSKDETVKTGLLQGKIELLEFFNTFPEKKLKYRYAPDKWSVAQVLQHLVDAERVFQYRALRFARADVTPLPGFDQDKYVMQCVLEGKTLADLQTEFMSVREATISLFNSFLEKELLRRGTAGGILISSGAIAFVILGHQRHHLQIIWEKYF